MHMPKCNRHTREGMSICRQLIALLEPGADEIVIKTVSLNVSFYRYSKYPAMLKVHAGAIRKLLYGLCVCTYTKYECRLRQKFKSI